MKWFIPTLLLLALPAAGCSGKKDAEDRTGDDKPRVTKKPDRDPPRAADTGSKTPAGAGSKTGESRLPPGPALSLTSKQYREEFDAEYGKAQKKFRNRLVELTGPVARVSQYGDDAAPRVSLEGVPGKLDNVQLHFRDPNQWKKAVPGQTLKVRGKPADLLAASNLELCEIVEASGGPAPVTAAALAAEFAADPKAPAKYNGKPILLTGEIGSIDSGEESGPDVRVTLKTARPEPAVICFVQVPIRKQLTGTLKQGQKIRVWGQEVNGQKDKVQLYQAVLYEASE